jgi:hypothetical protein
MHPIANIGTIAAALGGNLAVHSRRPYIDDKGTVRVLVDNSGRSVVVNTPALLRYDEWKDIDRDVAKVAVERLVANGVLISRGLTYNLGSPGITESVFQKSSDMTGANISMDAATRGEEDTPAFDQASVPVPVIHKDFRLNSRPLQVSRLLGSGLDTMAAEGASMSVARSLEDMLLSTTAIVVGGNTIYGYINHPNRNTIDLAEMWDNVATTGLDIFEDVQAMVSAARADNHFGPYVLHIPGSYQAAMDNDFAPGSGDTRTVRQRLLLIEGLEEIVVCDRLAAHNVVLVQMTKSVVDLAKAQDIVTVNWQEMGGALEMFRVYAIQAPRVKSDYDGRSGIVHLRPA